jgi:hypothetical protein
MSFVILSAWSFIPLLSSLMDSTCFLIASISACFNATSYFTSFRDFQISDFLPISSPTRGFISEKRFALGRLALSYSISLMT